MTMEMSNKLIRRLAAFAMVAVVALFATGCTSKADQLKESVTGMWNVVSVGGDDTADTSESTGLYTVYIFEEDGTFTMRLLFQGTPIDRTGTWKVENDKILIDVPEMKETDAEGSGPIVSLKAEAIEGAEVTVAEEELAVTINDQEMKAEPMDDAAYDEAVAVSAEFAPKKIAVGDKVEGETCTFTVKSFGFKDEVYPDDTSGYYTYFPDESGKSYLVAELSFKNTAPEYFNPGQSTSASIVIDGNKYGADVNVVDGSGLSTIYSIDAQETSRVVIASSIPDEVKKSAKSVVLTWSVPKDVDGVHAYYNSALSYQAYELTK